MLDITIGSITLAAENIKAVTWCVVAGVIIASVVIFFNKTMRGTLVRLLLAAEALSPESAKTLDELGVEDKAAAIKSIERSDILKRIIKTDGEGYGEDARYYIPEDQKGRAEHQFLLRGNELFVIIITAVFFFAVGIAVTLIF